MRERPVTQEHDAHRHAREGDLHGNDLEDRVSRRQRRHPKLVVARGLLGGLGAVFGFFAFSVLPLADVYAIAFCTPVVVTIASIPLLGERVGAHRWAAVLAGFLGILIMVRPGFDALSLGHLAALGMVGAGTGGVLILRTISREEERGVMVAAVMLGLLVVSLPACLLVARAPAWTDIGLVALSGLMMGSAQFLIVEALRQVPAASIAPMQYTMLVWALIYGLLVFGDPVEAHVLAGAVVVIASSLYIMHRERMRGRTLRAHVK
jgi:drug/metabolite transporter (DMT)-like permease